MHWIDEPEKCDECDGRGFLPSGTPFQTTGRLTECESCDGTGWFGIDPSAPIPRSHQNRAERVKFLQVRYASGVALWNDDDAKEEMPNDGTIANAKA